MALAAATHHSAQQNAAPRGPKTGARAREGVEHEQHDGLRAQKPPLPGVRPGSLFDPGPQRSDRTVRHSAGDAPLLVVPALRGDDGVDGTTLRFLLEQNLSLKKKQEEEEKERELKEKKAQKVKREEKLLELEARQRAVSQELDTLLLVPFVRRSDQEEERVVKLQMLLQRLSRDRSALLLAPSKRKKKKKRRKKLPKSSSFLRLRRCGQGFRSCSSLSGAQCSFTLSSGPRCFASWPVCTKRTVMPWVGFCLSRCSSRCVPSCCRLQARDARHHGSFGPEVQLRRHWWHVWLVLLVTLHLSLCFLPCLQARDALHHGRYGPEGSYVSPCRKLRISAVAVPRRSSISCCGAEAYSHGLAVQQTIECPQLLRYMWSMSLLCRLCSFPGGLQFSTR